MSEKLNPVDIIGGMIETTSGGCMGSVAPACIYFLMESTKASNLIPVATIISGLFSSFMIIDGLSRASTGRGVVGRIRDHFSR